MPHTHTHIHTYTDNSPGCDGCPDADPLQAENRWVPFLSTKWQMVPGWASRELITGTLLAARLITPPRGPDDKNERGNKKKKRAWLDMMISFVSFSSVSQAWFIMCPSWIQGVHFEACIAGNSIGTVIQRRILALGQWHDEWDVTKMVSVHPVNRSAVSIEGYRLPPGRCTPACMIGY